MMTVRNVTGRTRTVLAVTVSLVLIAIGFALVLALAPPGAQAQQGPPGPVNGVSLTRADGTVTASWNAVSGATHYHVTYTTNGGQSWYLAAFNHTETSITFSADNAKTYIVGARAGNGDGWSGWRNSPPSGPYTPDPAPAPTPTPTPNPPGAVNGVSLTRADGTVTASWNAAAGATHYHVTYTINGGVSWHLAAFNHTQTSIIFSANNSKTYIVGARAGNGGGWSVWRNSPAIGPYTPDPTPTPTPTPTATPTPTPTPTPTATPTPTPTATPTPTPTPTPTLLPEICEKESQPNAYYELCLKSVTAGDGSLTFDWDWRRPDDFDDAPGQGFVHYEFERLNPGGEWGPFYYLDSDGVVRKRLVEDEDARSYTLTGLNNGQTYNVRMSAHYYKPPSHEGYSSISSNEGFAIAPLAPTPTPIPGVDYDADDDGLIEITNISQIAVILYDVDGDGTPTKNGVEKYRAAYPDTRDNMGCPDSGCVGYELTSDLTFDSNANWGYIVYAAIFEGNGFTLSNL